MVAIRAKLGIFSEASEAWKLTGPCKIDPKASAVTVCVLCIYVLLRPGRQPNTYGV